MEGEDDFGEVVAVVVLLARTQFSATNNQDKGPQNRRRRLTLTSPKGVCFALHAGQSKAEAAAVELERDSVAVRKEQPQTVSEQKIFH